MFPPFQLVDCGLDGCLLLLQVCLDEVLLNAREAENFQLKHRLLSAIFRYCLDKTYFSACFCEALMSISDTDGLLETLSNVLELSVAEKVGIGLALSDSDNSGIKLKGKQFVKLNSV
jgi:CCR4-NOT transcription complex subunit 1